MKAGIYKILHRPSGLVYVGSAVNLERRRREHMRELRSGTHKNTRLQAVWNAAQPDDLAFEVLEIVVKQSALLEREQYWIDRLMAAKVEYGFNINPRAGSVYGLKQSPAARARISAAHRGRPKRPDAIAKTAAWHRGRNMPPGALSRAWVTRRLNGQDRQTAQTRARIAAALLGRPRRPESIAAVWRARRASGRDQVSLDTRARIAAALRGRIVPQDVRKRIASAQLARWRGLRLTGARFWG